MKYANYDETTGKLLGWYDKTIHTNVPTPNIKVSEKDWQAALSNNYNFIDTSTNTLSYKDFSTFIQRQEVKITEIKSKFTKATKAGFQCTNGITMDADLIDIITLKAGYDLAVSLGATTMNITDYNNSDHLNIAIADVFAMIQELGMNYETLRVKKNTLRKQAKDATDQAGLDKVVW